MDSKYKWCAAHPSTTLLCCHTSFSIIPTWLHTQVRTKPISTDILHFLSIRQLIKWLERRAANCKRASKSIQDSQQILYFYGDNNNSCNCPVHHKQFCQLMTMACHHQFLQMSQLDYTNSREVFQIVQQKCMTDVNVADVLLLALE